MLYAIGDIHGNLEALTKLHDMIMEDSLLHDESHTVLFIGDYIDRGPDNPGVIDLVQRGFDGFNKIYLEGNHENMAIDSLDHGQDADMWLYNGGAQTVSQFGEEGLERDLKPFLKTLKRWHLVGNFLFVHAGVFPGRSLEENNIRKLSEREPFLWIREPFLSFPGEFKLGEGGSPVTVVHGHSPTPHDPKRPKDHSEPIILSNRINLDTGAVWTGILSAAKFDNDGESLICTLTTR